MAPGSGLPPPPPPDVVLRGVGGAQQCLAFGGEELETWGSEGLVQGLRRHLISGTSVGTLCLWSPTIARAKLLWQAPDVDVTTDDGSEDMRHGVLGVGWTTNNQCFRHCKDGRLALHDIERDLAVITEGNFGLPGFCGAVAVAQEGDDASSKDIIASVNDGAKIAVLSTRGNTLQEVSHLDLPPLERTSSGSDANVKELGMPMVLTQWKPYLLLAGFESGHVAIWDVRKGTEPLAVVHGVPTCSACTALAVLRASKKPDSAYLLCGGAPPVKDIDSSTAGSSPPTNAFFCHNLSVTDAVGNFSFKPNTAISLPAAAGQVGVGAMAARADGRAFAVGDWHGKVRVYSRKVLLAGPASVKHHHLATLDFHGGRGIACAAYEGKALVVGGKSQSITIWHNLFQEST
eukprot:Clim_evm111s152 gene=Clim_evmTU111s152